MTGSVEVQHITPSLGSKLKKYKEVNPCQDMQWSLTCKVVLDVALAASLAGMRITCRKVFTGPTR
jgi:hypothetical protein